MSRCVDGRDQLQRNPVLSKFLHKRSNTGFDAWFLQVLASQACGVKLAFYMSLHCTDEAQ